MGDSGATGTFQIQLEAVFLCPLGELWRNNVLTGTFWRLYRNRSDGAGVLMQGRRVPIRGGKYYLLPPWCDLPTWCDDPHTIQLYLHFNLPFLNGTAPLFELEADPGCDALADKVEAALANHSPQTPLYALALASAAAARLPESAFSPRLCDFAIARVCEYLRVNLNKPIGVEDMAAWAHLPVADFVRRFKESTGSTPYHYLSDLRYERAERLLRSGRYSLGEICEQIGINDRFHFSRCFKRRYGYAPSFYRTLGKGGEYLP